MAMTKRPKLPEGFTMPEIGAKGRAFIETGSTGQSGASAAVVDGGEAPPKLTEVPATQKVGGVESRPSTYLLRMDTATKDKINLLLDRLPGRLSMQKYIIGLIEADLMQNKHLID